MTHAFETELRDALKRQAETVPHDVVDRQLAQLNPRGGPALRATGVHRRRWQLVSVVAAVAATVVVSLTVPALVRDSHAPELISLPPASPPVDGIAGESIAGHHVDAANRRGEPLLVVAWGSWCTPCRQQLSEVEEVSEHTGLAVVGLASDEDPATAAAFADALGLRFESIHDPRRLVAERLPGGVRGYPTTWLLDEDGAVVGAWAGLVDDWGPVADALGRLSSFEVDRASYQPGEQVRVDYPSGERHSLDFTMSPMPTPDHGRAGLYQLRAGPDGGSSRWVQRPGPPRGSLPPTISFPGDPALTVPTDAAAGRWWLCSATRGGDCRPVDITDP